VSEAGKEAQETMLLVIVIAFIRGIGGEL